MPAMVRSPSNRTLPQKQQEQQRRQRSTLARLRLSAKSLSSRVNKIIEGGSGNDPSMVVVTPVYEAIDDSYSLGSAENYRAQKTPGFGGEDFHTDSKNETNVDSSLGSEALRFIYGPSPSLHADVFQIPPTSTPEELGQSYKKLREMVDLALDCPPQYQKEVAILLGMTKEQLTFLRPKEYFEIKRDAIIHAYDILKRKNSRIEVQQEEEGIIESVAEMDSDTSGEQSVGRSIWSEDLFGNEGVGKDIGTVETAAMTDTSNTYGNDFVFGNFASQDNEWFSNEVGKGKDENTAKTASMVDASTTCDDNFVLGKFKSQHNEWDSNAVIKDKSARVETEADRTNNQGFVGGDLETDENVSVANHFEHHPPANFLNNLDDDETIDYDSDQTMETENYSHHHREGLSYASNGNRSTFLYDGDENTHPNIGAFSQSGYKYGEDEGPPIGPIQFRAKGFRRGRHHRNKSPTDPVEYFKQHSQEEEEDEEEEDDDEREEEGEDEGEDEEKEAFNPFEVDGIIGEFIDIMGESVDDTLTSVEAMCDTVCCQMPEKF